MEHLYSLEWACWLLLGEREAEWKTPMLDVLLSSKPQCIINPLKYAYVYNVYYGMFCGNVM